MGSDWRKCKSLSKGDKRAVQVMESALAWTNHNKAVAVTFTVEAMMHMTGLLKMLAGKLAELETKPKAATRRKE